MTITIQTQNMVLNNKNSNKMKAGNILYKKQ